MKLGSTPLMVAAGALFLFVGSSADAACVFPQINLGSFPSSEHPADFFARDVGGLPETGAARSYHAQITGCAATDHYRLMINAAPSVRATNGAQFIDVVPFVIAIDGAKLSTPFDLTHANGPLMTGNPDLEVVFMAPAPTDTQAPGRYTAAYVVLFIDSP